MNLIESKRMALSIGVDVGGTKIAAVMSDQEGVVAFDSWATHQISCLDDLETNLFRVVAACRVAADAQGERIVGLGLSCAAWLSLERGKVVLAANLGISSTEISQRLSDSLSLPVTVENDGNCAAWGEYRRGAGKGSSSLTLISLGTGVGGGIVADGNLLLGGHGLGGELGHLPAGDSDKPCSCGGFGCLEQFASGRALSLIASSLQVDGRLPSVISEPPSSAALVRAARLGDHAAITALDDLAAVVARAIRLIIPLVDPEVIALSGAVAIAAEDFILPAIRSQLRAHPSLPLAREPQRVVMSELGANAAAIGASELVWERMSESVHPPGRRNE